jgi:thiol-disulfide isomerase/thioredoxin
MKLLPLFFFLLVFIPARSQGILFSANPSWDEMLHKAEEADKLLFVDIYTDWCKPCREMDETVFKKQQVGERYNAGFINVKINAEVGGGISIAKKYLVDAYPTYLFINGKGELVYRFSGLASIQELLDHAAIAIAEQKNNKPIGEWMMNYPLHKNDPVFMRGYLDQVGKLKIPAAELYDEYINLLTPAARLEDSTVSLIAVNRSPLDIHSATFNFFWTNYPKLKTKNRTDTVLVSLLELSMRIGAHQVYRSGDEKELSSLLKLNDACKVPVLKKKNSNYQEAFYRLNKMPDQYVKYVLPQLEKQTRHSSLKHLMSDERERLANTLNNAARFIALSSDGKAELGRAEHLAKSCIDLKPTWFPTTFYIWHTYGLIQYKQGSPAAAIQSIRRAISLLTEDDARFQFKKQFEDDITRIGNGEKIL